MSRLIAVAVLAVTLASCTSSKDARLAQLDTDYNDQIRRLDEWRAQSLQDCEQASDPQECRSRVLKKYSDSKIELIEWRSGQLTHIWFPDR